MKPVKQPLLLTHNFATSTPLEILYLIAHFGLYVVALETDGVHSSKIN